MQFLIKIDIKRKRLNNYYKQKQQKIKQIKLKKITNKKQIQKQKQQLR